MRIRAPRFFLVAALVGSLTSTQLAPPTALARAAATQTSTQQQLVEDVQIEGNRRLRDEDIIYHIQTRRGDNYNEAQVRRDVQALLNLPFFDKTSVRVETETGPLGGVVVIFHVRELPIIRALEFKGLGSITESDVLKAFREARVGISKESPYDPVKANQARRIIGELLAAKGYPNATVEVDVEEVSQTSVAVTFNVEAGERVRVVDIQFEGNQVFSDGELRGAMKFVKEAGFITRFKGQDILDPEKLDADLRYNVVNHMRSKGYLQARTGEPRIEGLGPRRTGFPVLPLPLLSSTDEALRITVPVIEGKLFRIGELKIEGNSILSEQDIRNVIGLRTGDVANGQRLYRALQEDLGKLYGRFGFIQYTFEFDPEFKENPQNPNEGIADFTINITEGKQFSLRRLEFQGNTYTRDNVLRREVAVNEGDVFDQTLWEFSVLRLNQTGFFDPIEEKRDTERRTDEEQGTVDVNLKVTERGRNQISFNGGVSGIGGSFFGFEYATNNLLGRGESLSFQLAYGNRQRSFLFSFTEPYVRDRPISVGFSLFTESSKFFGEGTALSQNIDALGGLTGNALDFLSVADENLFTANRTGASIFASSPLSEFFRPRSRRLVEIARVSRIGLSYAISRSSIEDPPVNEENDPRTLIPRVFAQPNLLTSRITPTFAYDTRNASIDPTRGRSVTLGFSLAGLGGDVRTYQPTLSYSQFIPVRRKRSEKPEVFGFRIIAGHIGSFGLSSAIQQAQAGSLSFIGGTPINERFFLGDEFTIRGYSVRSITPIVPLDVFVSSRNVRVAASPIGDVVPVEGLPQNLVNELVRRGTFTGATGDNSVRIFNSFQIFGGDTQLLGNFEYRIPIFGPLQFAAFADVGSAFNLRNYPNQTFSTEFLPDQFLAQTGGLAELAAIRDPQLALGPLNPFTGTRGLIIRSDRLVTKEEFALALRNGPVDPFTGLPFGFQEVYLRGETQTNTVARFSDALFSKLSDYRASVGGEFRIQLPVVNVPFRLIYAYNPKTRNDFFRERKTSFRFSIGRTF